MTDDADDADELADTAGELAAVLSELRGELDRERERREPPDPPRGPLGLPRPPSPSEVLQFADEVAIPATIAILEANVRVLEALQKAIRMAETGREVRAGGERAANRAADASRETLSRLEGALADLQRAVEGDGLPENETARELLEDARSLRDEVEARLEESPNRSLEEFGAASEDGGDGSGGDATDERDDGVEVDVEGELETLKDRYGEDGDEGDDTGESEEDGDAAGA